MATASFGRNTPLRLRIRNDNFSSCTTNNIGGPAYAYDVCVNLPPLSKDADILDGGSQYLEDMESILEGVTNTSTTETVLEECRYYAKPHLFRQHRCDLTALMTENERQRLKTKTTQGNNSPPVTCRTIGHDGLLERMEHYLAEGLIQALNNKQNNTNTKGTNTKSDDGGIPMVWTIQPTRRKNGNNSNKKKDSDKDVESHIRFKFSTDFGACFYLNEKESLEFIEILKKFSSKKLSPYSLCKMYYQVYTIDSSESRVVKCDTISSLIHEIVIATTTTSTTTNSQKEVDKTTYNDESWANGEDDDGNDGGNVATATPIATIAPNSGNNVDGSKNHDSSAAKEGTKKRRPTSSTKEESGGVVRSFLGIVRYNMWYGVSVLFLVLIIGMITQVGTKSSTELSRDVWDIQDQK
ncbi:hypothetical protein FRACYDRAFT_247089 [Fragilariopsis cylindrus CCMP1102]|uniref:Uncharacterized protein n=1 Tax=Fragilariopsis cylindrus CCMP1102 TaxID=635003 RepID=A0A1E7EXG7_9STRA|nr:hypothetical protein FRACYDRAFT_247089 [Fragilariopsis cylindrus CCMP1102]|eukprot:OEU10547.1 hypothetical protein FRACYDRAFT_247089 [Fragilariopsis cylindrus CCMP1102]